MRNSKRTVQQSRVQSIKTSAVVKKELSINEQCLKKSLKLLGVTEEKFQKQTRSNLKGQIFPRTLLNVSNSKQFFFISFFCVKYILTVEEYEQLTMWYPPRTVNEQIEFKKTLFKLLQKAQAHGRLPKNILISKMTLMGEGTTQSILQFLRILAQLSLRALYIEKYSKEEKLIQIITNKNYQFNSENDINRFYVFPFTETATNLQSPIQSIQELQHIKLMFKIHIENYRKKILTLRTIDETDSINPQALMSQILEQKQLANTLQNKVSRSIYSQNRAFDRRIVLDKNIQTWKQLMSIPCNFINQEEDSVLKVEGQTAKVLANWKPISGTPNLIQVTKEKLRIDQIKKKCQYKMEQLACLRKKLLGMIKNV